MSDRQDCTHCKGTGKEPITYWAGTYIPTTMPPPQHLDWMGKPRLLRLRPVPWQTVEGTLPPAVERMDVDRITCSDCEFESSVAASHDHEDQTNFTATGPLVGGSAPGQFPREWKSGTSNKEEEK